MFNTMAYFTTIFPTFYYLFEIIAWSRNRMIFHTFIWHLATAFNFLAVHHFHQHKSCGTKKRNTHHTLFISAILCIFSRLHTTCSPGVEGIRIPQEDLGQVTDRVHWLA
jgi:Na+-transporting NADH:ubiquinone oxidoreductase subunit NqrB